MSLRPLSKAQIVAVLKQAAKRENLSVRFLEGFHVFRFRSVACYKSRREGAALLRPGRSQPIALDEVTLIRHNGLVSLATWLAWAIAPLPAYAIGAPQYVASSLSPGAFALVDHTGAAPLVVSDSDWPGIVRAAADLAGDIKKVTGVQPALLHDRAELRNVDAVIIGTIGKSPLIDDLVRRKRLDVSAVAGMWESAVTTIVDRPMPGVRRALVIAGSDKRGTIFAIYDLSEQIGVSPWTWWADVRVPHQDALFVEPGRHIQPVPAVKYRGIFLNDEAPALSGWVHEKYGGYNSKFYVHVFELLLRLKANFLWPAMWNSAFAADDPLNPSSPTNTA